MGICRHLFFFRVGEVYAQAIASDVTLDRIDFSVDFTMALDLSGSASCQ
jgi:hypothetical protein